MHATPIKTHVEPTKIAADTYLIHDHQGEGVAPVQVQLNTMLIRGTEPVVVDTGAAVNREQYLADLFSLVEPEDVRWLFLSHDDPDHIGNVEAVMDACPNATLVTSWFAMERNECSGFAVPPSRWRWVNDGETFAAGDRILAAVRPPLYDAPTTRGLYDTSTGVYWAADCFATPVLAPTRFVDELDPEFWAAGFAQFQQWISPWFSLVDEQRYLAVVNRLASHDIRAIAGCHTPVVSPEFVGAAFDLLRGIPSARQVAQPGQPDLETMLGMLDLAAA
jgi:flavorubredoxin